MHSERPLHRQRPSFVQHAEHKPTTNGASTLSDVRGALEVVEENLRRNVAMSQHPAARQAHEASGGLLSQPSVLELKQQKEEETIVKKRQQQAIEQLRSSANVEQGSDAMVSPFLAGGGGLKNSGAQAAMPPAVAAAHEAIAQSASKQFESMLLASVRASSSPLRSASPTASLPAGGGGSVASPIGSSRQQSLRHPNSVPISQYVKTQLDALRYSLGHGYTYHEQFDQHAIASVEARRIVQGLQPARAQCSVNFVVENKHQEQSVSRLLAIAAREEEMKVQRRMASADEVSEWFNSQIELKREMAQLDQRKRHPRRGSALDETDSAAASGVYHQGSNGNDAGPLAALTAGGARATEREVATAVQSLWVVLVAMATRTTCLTAICDTLAHNRRAQTEQDTRRRMLNTENMQALVALDTMKRKYDKCRVILKGFVQSRVRAKHHASVDLILRVLRHRHRMVKTNYQVRWYRRSVVVVQRQVRIFLQALAARRMLLHLQWLQKECQLLQVPNMALYLVHQQWSEQRRMVDTTRLMGVSDSTSKRGGIAAALALASPVGPRDPPMEGKSAGSVPQQQQQHPLRKPGSREFVIWHTRVTWVPAGGVPLEYRTAQVNSTAQALIRSFVSSLMSADANRRFFVKQRARYETDGHEKLGLPRPKRPIPPIYQLFMPSTTLRMTVGLAQKEKGEHRDHHASPASAAVVPPAAATKLLSAMGTQSPPVGKGAKGVPCADQQLEAPGKLPGGLDGPPKATKAPLRRASPRTSALQSTVSPLSQPQPVSPRCSGGGANDGVSTSASRGQPSCGDFAVEVPQDRRVSQWERIKHQQLLNSGDGSGTLEAPLRKRGSVTLLPSESCGVPSPSPSRSAAGGRRSVFTHFDDISGNEELPTTVRTDADYAALLGKPSVHAMRTFLDTKNTLHLRGMGRGDEGRERTRLQRAAASGSPTLPMHLVDITHYYHDVIIKDHSDLYHIPGQPTAGPLPPSPRPAPPPALPQPPTVRSSTHRATAATAMRRTDDVSSTLLGGDVALAAHRPAAPGSITRRQHEERLRRVGPEAHIPSPMETFARPQAAMGSDVERDVPRLLAFSGSSDVQRKLMVLGGRRYTSNGPIAPSGPTGSSSTARRPVEQEQVSAVPLLEGVAEARHRATARVRSLNFV